MNAPRIAKATASPAPATDQAAFLRLFWHATRKVVVPRTTAEIGARLGLHDPIARIRQAVSVGVIPNKNPWPNANPDAIWELTEMGKEALAQQIEAETGIDIRFLIAAPPKQAKPNRPHARSVVIRGERFDSPKAAAAHFGLSERTVQRMIELGRTDSIGLGSGGANNSRRTTGVVVRGRKFVSINQLAKHVGRSPTTIGGMIREGRTERLAEMIKDADAKAEVGQQ